MKRVLASALVLVACAAGAADTTTRPFPGVTWLHHTTTAPLDVHLVTVDLCAAGVSTRATTSAERGKTVSAFTTQVGAEVGINGDFFTFSTYAPSGLAAGNRTLWADSRDQGFEAKVVLGQNRAEILPATTRITALAPWMEQVVSSRPQILKGGVIQAGFSTQICAGSVTAQGDCTRDPRTAIGLSKDRTKLSLAVVDGRQPAISVGMTTRELAQFLLSHGASDAVNMDSGGSSELWLKGKGVLNHPSDGVERVVANHLAVFAKGSGLAKHCPPPASDGGSVADAGAPHDGGLAHDAGAQVDAGAPGDAGAAADAGAAPDAGGEEASDAGPWGAPDAGEGADAGPAGPSMAPVDAAPPTGGCAQGGSQLAVAALAGVVLALQRRRRSAALSACRR
ncbi:MAG: phosphodiester glycosidase family protein [Myxococcaceae bacterium]|nr:phosphodiester glycosidase family protein [Myxococcaceae bacterium]